MPEMSIGRAIGWLAEADPDAPALVVDERVVGRGELDRATNRLARGWVGAGLEVDDLVTIARPNGLDFVLACVAAWKAGATPQPLSPRWPGAERRAVLELARPWRVVDGPVVVPDVSSDPLPDRWASSWKAPTSSGSTARAKIVRAAAPARVDPQGRVAAFVPRDAVQLVAGPLWHAAPFVYAMRGLMTGHTLVLMDRFDPGDWLRLVERHRVTWSVLVPTTMRQVWRHPGRAGADVASLESVLHLGARCPGQLKRDWLGWLGPDRVDEVYAGTESQGVAHVGGRDWLEHPGTVGRAVGGSAFRVVGPDGRDRPPGEEGEVLMRRDRPTYSYLGAVAEVRDGWHTLGDSGWLDEDGWLYLGDRLDDLVNTAGSKVHPAAVEAVLEQHPDVRSALVVGRADVDLGERVHAVVETDLDPEELEAWARDRLSPEQRPRSWQRVDVPLRDDTGKARRRDWR